MKITDVFGNEKIVDMLKYMPRPTKFKTKAMQKKAAMMSSTSQSWETPLWLYEHIKQLRGISNYYTDPATNEENPLGCKLYYTEEDDGLLCEWKNTVFINPPFGFGYYRGVWSYITGLWITEAWRRVFEFKEVDLVTMLLPARTSPKVFHSYIWDYERSRVRDNVALNFYPKRIKFSKSPHSAPFDSMIVDFVNPTSKHKTLIQQLGELRIDN